MPKIETREDTTVTVFVDGRRVGKVWRFDGYDPPPAEPSPLWLGRLSSSVPRGGGELMWSMPDRGDVVRRVAMRAIELIEAARKERRR